MDDHHGTRSRFPSRREFLQRSGGALSGAALVSTVTTRAYAAEDNTIKVALVGCGGRGTGAAANALSTSGPTQLWAVADVFENRINTSLQNLSAMFGGQIDVPRERQFVGFSAFKQAIDSIDQGDVVLLATPPAFRPIHLEYAVERGRNVFMEKSFAVDAPGIRRVLKAGRVADDKHLKIAGGLMSRHSGSLQKAIAQLHAGAIGDIITCWAYREHGPVGLTPKSADTSELAHQIRNYSCFTWLNGSFILDWLIHNLDVCCWVKDAWPVSAQGQGGRQQRQTPDPMFDHFAVEYSFDDGTRLFAQGRHMLSCWSFFGDIIHGARGSAVLGEGISSPRIYKGHQPTPENLIWTYEGRPSSPYQVEHDRLFEAICQDTPYNETQRCAYAAMTGILGRMAAESGKMIRWEEAIESTTELAPGLDEITWKSEPPTAPDEDGKYPVVLPGLARVL